MTHQEIVALANALDPICRCGPAIECCNCHEPIVIDAIYFVDTTVADHTTPWCRSCALKVLVCLFIIDFDTAREVPVLGPVPTWMSSTAARTWKAPLTQAARALDRDNMEVPW